MVLSADSVLLQTWKRNMLAHRGLDAPDGRALYSYRLELAEFKDLEDILCRVRGGPSDLVEPIGFPCLFVLYGAEWWRRRFHGEQWEWRPILEAIGKNPNAWSQSQRSECVRVGLKDWGLRLSDRGLRYLGSLAIQGGLPLHVLAEARSGIGALLGQVVRQAQQGTATLADLTAWVESLQGMLPQTYRQQLLYALLADVAWTVLQLKAQANLSPGVDAIATLDAAVPDWRSRFPLSIEDEHARGLMEQLVRDAAAVRTEVQITPFQLARLLVPDEAGGVWRLHSLLNLPDAVRREDLARTFGIAEELPYTAELSVTAGVQRLATTLRRLAGQDAYRLQRRPWRFAEDAAGAEHIIALAVPDGRHWSAALRRGDELDDDLPWVFTTGDRDHTFVCQGSGGVSASDVLVAYRYNWTIEGDGVEQMGDMAALPRRLARVRGTVVLRGSGLSCRIRTGQAGMGPEETYTWSGARLWLDFHSPAAAFRGMPVVSKIRADGSVARIEERPGWRALGTPLVSPEPLGPIEATYPAIGEVRHRTRMVVLPSDAALIVEPRDAGAGELRFERWQASAVRILEAGIRCESVQDGRTLVVSVAARGTPPEYVTLEVFWRHTPTPARLRVPFPARGVRGFAADGREVRSGSLLAAQRLAGVRLRALTGRENASMALEFGVGRDSPTRIQVLRAQPGTLGAEIRLQDYASDIQQILSTDDHVDVDVRLTLRIDGAAEYELRLARYAAKLEIAGETVSLAEVAGQALEREAMQALPVMALRIEHPGDEPERLTPAESEGVPMGSWHFDLQAREPGAWLIYPGPAAGLPFRPTLCRVPGEADAATPLSKASAITRPAERGDAITAAIASMANDFLDAGWTDVEWAAKQFGQLPLTTLDHWRCFARSTTGMATLALRFGSLPEGFLERFAEELPFAWEMVPLSAWRHAVDGLARQCREIAPEPAATYILRSHLAARLSELTAHHGALQFLLGIAAARASENGEQDLAALRLAVGPASHSYLFDGDNSRLMRLRQRHADETWPVGAQAAITRARRDPFLALHLAPEQPSYAEGVVNLPVLLAVHAATGRQIPGVSHGLSIEILRAHRAFDPDWFDEAYNQTVARCVSEAVIS